MQSLRNPATRTFRVSAAKSRRLRPEYQAPEDQLVDVRSLMSAAISRRSDGSDA